MNLWNKTHSCNNSNMLPWIHSSKKDSLYQVVDVLHQHNNVNLKKVIVCRRKGARHSSIQSGCKVHSTVVCQENLLICISGDAPTSNRARATSATEAQPSPVSQQQQVALQSYWSEFFLPLHATLLLLNCLLLFIRQCNHLQLFKLQIMVPLPTTQ